MSAGRQAVEMTLELRADGPQTVDVTTSSYADAWAYVERLEQRGFSVSLAPKLDGVWLWTVKAFRPSNLPLPGIDAGAVTAAEASQ